MYFSCDICGASKDIIELIYEAIKRGVSTFLKIFLLLFLGFLSYNCWYLHMVFLICWVV